MAMYCAIVWAHLLGLEPIPFALLTALLLASGFLIYSTESGGRSSQHNKQLDDHGVLTSVNESMEELYALQQDIDFLQRQFALEKAQQGINDRDDNRLSR